MCTGKREREQHQPSQASPASTTSETERIRDQPDPRNSCPNNLDQGALQDIAGLFKDQAGYEEQVSEEGSLPGLTSKSEEDCTASEDSQDDSGDEGYSDWKKSTNDTWVPTRKRNHHLEGEDSSTDSEDEDEERHTSGRGGHRDRKDSPGQVLMRRLEKSRAANKTLSARPRPEPVYTSSEYDNKEDWTCEDTDWDSSDRTDFATRTARNLLQPIYIYGATCADDQDHQWRRDRSAVGKEDAKSLGILNLNLEGRSRDREIKTTGPDPAT